MTKKIYFMLLSVLLSVTYLSAQVVQTVNVPTAGGLATAIGSNLKTVTDLTLTGTINAADFNTIKQMTALKNLDMSKVNVVDNAIPQGAFQGRVLNNLQLPTTITSIGGRAFFEMSIPSLDLTQIPGLENIGHEAFNGITVSELDFSKSTNLKSIGYNAFANVKIEKKELDFSNSPKLSGGEIYANYGSFSFFKGHVILPKEMTHLFNNAFCEFRGSVEFPPNLESIGEKAFLNSTPSQSLQLPSTIKSIGGRAFFEMSIPSLDLTQIPGLENIGHEAFNGITVSELDFSKSTNLKSIGYNAFANVKIEKKELDFSNSPKLSGGEIYANYGSFSFFKGHVILPKAMTHVFKNAFTSFKGTVELPQGLKTIGENAFRESIIDRLVLPSTLETIEAMSFCYTTVKELDLSQTSNLVSIKHDAFNGIKTNVLDFTKSINLRNIDYHAFMNAKLTTNVLDFSNNSNLSTGEVYGNSYGAFSEYSGHVILPKKMTHLFNNAFYQFEGTVELPQGLKTIGENAFRESIIDCLVLPSTLETIEAMSFCYTTVKELDLSQTSNLVSIKHDAFNGIKTNVLDFTKSINLRNIDYHAFMNAKLTTNVLDFSNNSNLSTGEVYGNSYGAFSEYSGHVILPKKMTHLFNNAFYQFEGTLDLPKGLKTIGNSVFQNSTITSIELPSNVISIGTNAFNGASQLSKIISNNPAPPTLGGNVFSGVNKETTILEVPGSSINLYGTAAQWKDFLNIKVGVPSKLDLTYKITSKVWPAEFSETDNLEIPYQAVRIGEYYWMNTNFNHVEPKRQRYSANAESLTAGEENNYPLTQSTLDKYLSQMEVPDKNQLQVDPAQIRKDFGSYYSYNTQRFMSKWGRVYENNSTENNSEWNMPYIRDYRQLIAMSPFVNNNAKELSAHEAMYALAAGSKKNVMAGYSIIGSCGGKWGYWAHDFGDVGGDKYDFGLMPSGLRFNGLSGWGTEICGEAKKMTATFGDLIQMYHRAVLPAQDGTISFHEILSTLQQDHHDGFYCENGEGVYHSGIEFQWFPVRWCRLLTDEELGYKLYIKIENIDQSSNEWTQFAEQAYEIDLLNKMRNENIPTDQTSILKLGLHDAVPAGYIELPHGYIRGFYVQHILDKPNTTVTVADVMKYAYGVQDFVLDYKQEYGRLPGWSIPSPTQGGACQPKARTVESDEIVVPFKTDASVSLYPNPVQDVLNISGEGVEKVTIYDMSGRQVSTAKNVNTISVSELSKGTYLVRVLTANGESTHKVIKK